MSFHDHRQFSIVGAALTRRHARSVLRGIGQITLYPTAPNIRLGSLRGDLKKVGGDMRAAIHQMELCD